MQGAISKIDHTTGTVDLRTQDGTLLTLHFPSNAIQDLKTGDQVTVKMEIAKTSGSAANMGAQGREHVRRNFLITRHLRDYLVLMLTCLHAKTATPLLVRDRQVSTIWN